MAKETRTFGPEIFFSFLDASYWIETYIIEYMEHTKDWSLTELEIKLMPSGGFRAGVSFERESNA